MGRYGNRDCPLMVPIHADMKRWTACQRELDRCSEERQKLLDQFDLREFGMKQQLNDVAGRCEGIDHMDLMQRQYRLQKTHVPKPKCSCDEHTIMYEKKQIRALERDLADLNKLQDYVIRVDIKATQALAARARRRRQKQRRRGWVWKIFHWGRS